MTSAVVDRLVLLDGGLATQLEAQGNDLSDELWSARLLADDPDQIRRAHRAYYSAGAEVAIAASYQASFAGFARRGLDRSQAERLMKLSVSLAKQVRDEFASDGRPRWVAASVGPYGASLGDGAEYRGRYGLSRRELWDFHRPRLEVLAAAEPDFLAIETIPDAEEAAVVISALEGLGVPAWLSYTVADGRTRAGQPLAEAFALAAARSDVIAVGVNCSAPLEVGPALRILRNVTAKACVVYPNSGERWDAETRSWRGVGGFDPAVAREWMSAGPGFVGGCCRWTPADIATLAAQLAEAEVSSNAASQPR